MRRGTGWLRARRPWSGIPVEGLAIREWIRDPGPGLAISDCVGSSLGLAEKRRLHEHLENRFALNLIESPEPLRLPRRELQARQLQVFGLDPGDQCRRRNPWEIYLRSVCR